MTTKTQRNQWVRQLESGICSVLFTKIKPARRRRLRCTRNLSAIPAEFHPKTDNTGITDTSIAVFDLDKQGWKSFNTDSVIEFGLVEKIKKTA